MIFVTVGTHEQPFNRLVKYIDNMKKDKMFDDEVVIQTGYSTYEPNYCTWKKFYSYQQMIKFVDEARIVISHGGPSSFIMPLQIGKIPIVVPRQKKFDEHVNDHQVEFTQEVYRRMGTIITVIDIEDLGKTILDYDIIMKDRKGTRNSNNAKFNADFEKIVDEMMSGRKQKR